MWQSCFATCTPFKKDYKPSIQMIELNENNFRSLLGAKICSSIEILTGCLGKLTSYLLECKLDDEIQASYDDEEAHVLSLKEFLICQKEDYVNASQTHSDLAMIVLRRFTSLASRSCMVIKKDQLLKKQCKLWVSFASTVLMFLVLDSGLQSSRMFCADM
nr:hypothetical protein [Tanacetum cinerariifolium]